MSIGNCNYQLIDLENPRTNKAMYMRFSLPMKCGDFIKLIKDEFKRRKIKYTKEWLIVKAYVSD